MIQPGTVAAIAASLMAQGENMMDDSDIFNPNWTVHRARRIKQFVRLAAEIAREAELLHNSLEGRYAQPEKR